MAVVALAGSGARQQLVERTPVQRVGRPAQDPQPSLWDRVQFDT